MKKLYNLCYLSNRILFFFILAILASIEVAGQIQLKIISSTDSSALPYATIVNLTTKIIYCSNESGEYTISQNLQDTFQVTYVGYKKKTFVPGSERQVIVLSPKEIDLKPVHVSSCKSFSKVSKSNLEGENKPGGFAGFRIGESTANGMGKVAMLLTSPNKNAIITRFSFWIKKAAFAPGYSTNAGLMITFYDADTLNDKPGELVSKNPIFYFPEKEGKQTVSLDSLRMVIPEPGIYVCFQYIMDEKYKWSQLVNSYLGSTDTTIFIYGGLIEGVSRVPCKIAFYDIAKDEWRQSFFSRGQIKYEMELKYCNE